MDPEKLQAQAARDQLWASLRQLRTAIRQLAQGQFDGTDRERMLVQLVARIVEAELKFREEETD
jgi:hypothetical protein